MERKEHASMNDVVATNIRRCREHLAWTQEQLAEASRVNVRTVQRAENGLGMSAETLTALAGALNVSVEDLRLDSNQLLADLLGVAPEEVTPELFAAKVDEAKAKFMTVDLTVVEHSADLQPVFEATAVHFDCIPRGDEIQDAAAALQQYLVDLMDIAGALDATNARDSLKEAFELVERLRKLRCVVNLALHRHQLAFKSGEPLAWRTLYAIVTEESKPKKIVMVEKGSPVTFSI
jgi:transcriptional regulator with XRE-family HTH domain